GRDDLTTQVEQPQNSLGCPRNRRHRLSAQHLLHVLDRDRELQAISPERAVLRAHPTPAIARLVAPVTAPRSTRSVTRSSITAEPSTPGRRPTSLRTTAASTTSSTLSITMPIRAPASS